MYVFSYTDIAPHEMGENETATMYNTAGTKIAESTCSVASYCNAILANAETYGVELSMLAMEVLASMISSILNMLVQMCLPRMT